MTPFSTADVSECEKSNLGRLYKMKQILDQHGNPIDLGAIREPQTEVGDQLSATASMRSEFERHPGRALTPAKLAAILQRAERGDILEQLDMADDLEEMDGQIYTQLSTRKLTVTTVDWDIEAPEGASAAEKALADEVRDWVRSIPQFEDAVMLPLLDAVMKSFSPVEQWWVLDQGTLQPRFAARPARWLCIDELDRQTLRLRSATTANGVPLTPWGWIVHQHRSRNGYLARAAMARVLAMPYAFKNFSIRDLAEFLEIYGLPLRLGQYPVGASDTEKRTLLRAVTQIGHDAAGIIPNGMKIDFLNAAQGNEGPFKTMWDGMDAVISKIILGQTLTSGEGKHGSQALGAVHNEVRTDILKSDCRRLAATLTEQLVRPMVMLNKGGVDPRRLPRFVLEVPEPEDLALYAEALPKLAAAGMRIGVDDLHRRLRIERADDDEEILGGSTAGAAPMPAGAKPGADPVPPRRDPTQAALSAALPPSMPPRDPLDDLVDDALSDWQPVMAPLVNPMLAALDAAVASGETLEQFRARLPALVAEMDNTPLAERLARASFTARLAGEAGAE